MQSRIHRWAILAMLLPGALPGGCAGEPEDPREAIVRASLAASPDAARTRVLLLGIDAVDMDIVDAMIARGELPAFARLMREGASGKLRSIMPLLSPVIWTTIATGKGPDKHGILDWEVEDPMTGQERPASSHERRVEAVWDVLGAYGTRVGVVGWLATWPAEPVRGFLVSNRAGFLAYGEDAVPGRNFHPPELAPRVTGLVRDAGDVTYEEIRRFVDLPEEEFREGFARASSPKTPANNLRLYYAAAETYRRIGRELWRTERPRFQATYFKLLDSACHLYMLFAPPRREDVTDEEFARGRGAVDEAYRYSDRILADWMEMADGETVLILVSDHGFKHGELRPPRGSAFLDMWAGTWHRPYGVFFAWGKGVRPGARVQGASVYDIAPTILGLAGYPQADDMPGRFLAEAFTTEPPASRVESYERGRADRAPELLMSAEDDPLLRDLHVLGYLGAGEKTSGSHIHLGLFHLSEGRLDEALAEARAALEKEPDSARFLYFLGRVQQQRREFEEAARAFRRVVELKPDLASARVSLALTLKLLGRRGEALRELRTAVETLPGDQETHFHLGRILLELGNREEGEAMLRRAIELEPDFPEARNRLGMLLVRSRQYEEAVPHLEAAVELRPGYPKAWNNLGVALLALASGQEDPLVREEMLDRALERMTRTIELFPDYAKAYGNRARVRILRSQREAAIADLEKALELDPGYSEAAELLKGLGAR